MQRFMDSSSFASSEVFLRLLLKQICNKKNLSASKIQICEVIKLSKIKVEKKELLDLLLTLCFEMHKVS